MKREQAALRQNEFDPIYLDHPHIFDDLSNLNHTLVSLANALPQASPEALREKLEKLDLRLLRYACTHLRVRLADAAMNDGAELLLRTMVNGSGEQAWADWLCDAPCWPALLKYQWLEAREQAWRLLQAYLEEQGIVLDFAAEQELVKGVVHLSLEDALGEELMKRFYPPNKEKGKEEGGEAEDEVER